MLNRAYLVAAGLLSLSIPFLRFEWFSKQPVAQSVYAGVVRINDFVAQASAIKMVKTKANHILLNSKSSEVLPAKTKGTKRKIAYMEYSMVRLQRLIRFICRVIFKSYHIGSEGTTISLLRSGELLE